MCGGFFFFFAASKIQSVLGRLTDSRIRLSAIYSLFCHMFWMELAIFIQSVVAYA